MSGPILHVRICMPAGGLPVQGGVEASAPHGSRGGGGEQAPAMIRGVI